MESSNEYLMIKNPFSYFNKHDIILETVCNYSKGLFNNISVSPFYFIPFCGRGLVARVSVY